MSVAKLLLPPVLLLSLTQPVHPPSRMPLTMRPRQPSSALQTTADSIPRSLLEDVAVCRPLVRFHQTSTEMHYDRLSSLPFLMTMRLDLVMLEHRLAMTT